MISQHFAEHVNKRLSSYVNSLSGPATTLNDSMRYVINAGGKRLRANLVYLIGEHYQLPNDALDPIAMAVECVHAFSLVHDDLPAMDDDDYRRHQPSCHKAFDEATAILCGDALLSESFLLLTQCNTDPNAIIRMTQQLAHAVGPNGLCAGQSLDMESDSSFNQGDLLLRIQTHKTGALFSASCELPYLASGKNNSITRTQLQELGVAIGHCLQISDDILDVTATEHTLGKTIGKDKEQNKLCYTNLFSITECKNHLDKWHKTALSLLDSLHIKSSPLVDLLHFLQDREH